MAKRKPWEHAWRRADKRFAGGGLGDVFLAEPISGEPSGKYALKKLRKQEDEERRARMHREVAILRTLKHVGIPKLIDSNVDEWENKEVELYLVVEYIEGPTLEKHIAEHGPLCLPDAVQMLLRLTEIVAYCHERGILHRDIKPDNVILRGGATIDPVLLDFGQSFNHEAESDVFSTDSGQPLGNRTVLLPELLDRKGDKRDYRTDIAQLCSVFHYALAGEHVVNPTDHQGRLPHQRPPLSEILVSHPPHVRSRVNYLFGTAFLGIDRRFQAVETLTATLRSLADPPPQGLGTPEEQLDFITSKIVAHAADGDLRYQRLFDIVEKTVEKAVGFIIFRVNRKLAGNEVTRGSHSFSNTVGGRRRVPGFMHVVTRGLTLSANRNIRFVPRVGVTVDGTEMVVSAKEDSETEETELYRVPIEASLDEQLLLENAKAYYLRGLESVVARLLAPELSESGPRSRGPPDDSSSGQFASGIHILGQPVGREAESAGTLSPREGEVVSARREGIRGQDGNSCRCRPSWHRTPVSTPNAALRLRVLAAPVRLRSNYEPAVIALPSPCSCRLTSIDPREIGSPAGSWCSRW